jgi:hypothetical protein
MKEYFFRSLGAPPAAKPPEPMRQEVERLAGLLRDVMQGGAADDFARAFQAFAKHGDDIRQASVLWIEVIQRLVQACEQRYPHKHGALKKSMVKTAARYLIDRDRFDVPGVPPYLQPFVLDIAVDWSIDILVSMTKQYGLWDTARMPERHLWSPVRWVLHSLKRIGDAAGPVLAKIPLAIWRSLEEHSALTPELKSSLDAVVKRRLLSRKVDLLGDIPDAVVWIGDHGDELKEALQLIFEAVQLAEGFLERSGSEKKAYARDLIFAVLEEYGMIPGDGLMGAIANIFIDIGIDSAVNLFNTFPQHSPAFKHRSHTIAGSPSPAPSQTPVSPLQPLLQWKTGKLRDPLSIMRK